MAIPFDRLERMARRSVDRVYAQDATLHPGATDRAGGRPRADPARPIAKIRGILDRRPGLAPIVQGNRRPGAGNDMRLMVEGETIEFSVDVRQFEVLGYIARQGDRLEVGDGYYSISSVRKDGHSSAVFTLVEAG